MLARLDVKHVTPWTMIFVGSSQVFLGIIIYYLRFGRNNFVGYRTKRSMASDAAWKYANCTFGQIFCGCGIINILVAIGELLSPYSNNYHHPVIYGLNFVLMMLGLGVSIYLTERSITRKFFGDPTNSSEKMR